jgi:medium-chain acyl-[acyl-carrier-protein] hydrolase
VERWLRAIRQPPDPVARLVCLPHAGAGTVPYRSWPARLPLSVEVLAALLPGRESRIAEPPVDDLGTIVRGVADALAGADRLPTVVFGHSFGAFLGYELCRRLGPETAVRHLIVSGSRAPHREPLIPPIADLPLPAFLAALRRFGGAPPEVFDEPALMELMEPALRADFSLAERYRLPAPDPLPLPLTVLGGADDPLAPVDALDWWRPYSTVGCTLRVFPGGHFFTLTEQDAVLAVVRDALDSVTAS